MGAGAADLGAPVEVALPDERGFPHKAQLDFLDNRLDQGTGTLRARAVMANKAGLFSPGLFARVRVTGSAALRGAAAARRGDRHRPDQQVRLRRRRGRHGGAPQRQARARCTRACAWCAKASTAEEWVITKGLQRARPGGKVTPKREALDRLGRRRPPSRSRRRRNDARAAPTPRQSRDANRMSISHFFIDRPIFAAVVSLVITIIGAIGYSGLGITQLPEITPPTITVTTSYPGASAQTVADTVAAPIEQEINGVEGMIYMASQSTTDGNLSLTVTFDVGTDIDKAQVLVQNRVSAAERRLPDEVRRNGLTVRKRSPDLLLAIHLISPDNTYDQVYISNYGLLNVRDKLMRLYGVADVSLFGVREYSMRVWLDPERIAAARADGRAGARRAARAERAGGGRRAGRAAGRLQERLPGLPADEGAPAGPPTSSRTSSSRWAPTGASCASRTSPASSSVRSATRRKGYADRYPAVIVIVDQQPGSNAVAATQGIKDAMAEMAKSFPKGLEYRITYNPDRVHRGLDQEALRAPSWRRPSLVVLVVLLFLKTWRATLIPVVAIPVSLIGTFAVMQAFGFSLNMLTLFGLVLAVGIVVDDAIVVVENVERKLKEGLSPLRGRARLHGRGRHRADRHRPGAAGRVHSDRRSSAASPAMFYRQFAITIATATAISLFLSLTLSPALCALLFQPHMREHDGIVRR